VLGTDIASTTTNQEPESQVNQNQRTFRAARQLITTMFILIFYFMLLFFLLLFMVNC